MRRRIVALTDPSSPADHDPLDDYDLPLAIRVLGGFHPAVMWTLVLCHRRDG